MGLLNIIRRMALREKQSIREISRRTGLSRNTIAKYLSAGTIEPTFTIPERPSKLDPFADKLAAWLKTEAGRSRKQRRTLKQLHADLVVLGFTGSCGHCRRGAFTLLGEPGLTFLKDIRCDRLFLTAQAIDTECASDTSWDLVQLKRAMMEAAAATVLVADSSRFGGRALYRVADLEKISAIITDDGLEEEQRQRFTDRGVELTLVPVPEG